MKVKVTRAIVYNGIRYEPGDVLEMDEKAVLAFGKNYVRAVPGRKAGEPQKNK